MTLDFLVGNPNLDLWQHLPLANQYVRVSEEGFTLSGGSVDQPWKMLTGLGHHSRGPLMDGTSWTWEGSEVRWAISKHCKGMSLRGGGFNYPPWNLTAHTWKWTVGRHYFPFGVWPIFRCELLISGRVMVNWWFGSRWFGIRIGVLLSNNLFQEGDPRNPNHQLTISCWF